MTTDVGDVRRWVPLSPESVVAERTPEALAAAIIAVLRERRRVNPNVFLEGFGSPGIAKRTLSLFERALAAPTGEPA